MSGLVSTNEFHRQLVLESINQRLSERDVMLLFHILHTFEIVVKPGVISETGKVIVAAITQRHAAEVVSNLFKNRRKKPDDERANCSHWYWLWNGEWGSCGHVFDENESRRLRELQSQLESHPWVDVIREED